MVLAVGVDKAQSSQNEAEPATGKVARILSGFVRITVHTLFFATAFVVVTWLVETATK